MLDRPISDPLAAIVGLLRPRAVLSKAVVGSGDWAVRYDYFGHPSFALVLEGSCWLKTEGEDSRQLSAGDFILLMETPAFILSSSRGPGVVPTVISSQDAPTASRTHGDADAKPDVRMMGGYFHFDSANVSLLRDLLPPFLHIRAADVRAGRLAWIVQAVAEETASERPGRDPILMRLVEVMLIEALRYRPDVVAADAPGMTRGLLSGLSDSRLAPALRCMHGDVAHKWTVAGLAKEVGMSRAAFAAHFTQKLGLPPMDYLLRWRMSLAKDLLRHNGLSLTEAAEATGYQSASAFSTAFSRMVGEAPSRYARRRQAA